jgi:hypothetical protein
MPRASELQTTYSPHPCASREVELDPLIAIYRRAIERYEEMQKAARPGRPDARKEEPNASGKPSLSQ